MNINKIISDSAAKFTFGLLGADEMVMLADEMLANGYDSPELLMLSLSSEANADVFVKAFGELNIIIPTRDSAKKILIRQVAEKIVQSNGDERSFADFHNLIPVLYNVIDGKYDCSDEIRFLSHVTWCFDDEIHPSSRRDAIKEGIRLANKLANEAI